MPKVVITGSRGLVGTDLVSTFGEKGWSVVAATTRPETAPKTAQVSYVPLRLEAVARSEAFLEKLAGADLLVHAAARIPVPADEQDPAAGRETFFVNTQGTYDLFDAAVRHNVPQVIFISTTNLFSASTHETDEATPPNPQSPYALSKLFGEQTADYFAKRSKTIFQSLRIRAPYGPAARVKAVIPTFLERAQRGEPLELWGKGLREQIFTYVRDISRACVLAAGHKTGGVFNITGPGPVTMKALAEAVLAALPDSRSKIVFNGKPDPSEGVRPRISIDAAQRAFGYRPAFGIAEGLKHLVASQARVPASA